MSAALPYYLFYVNEYAPSAPFYQSWSLGIEEKFYLIWPFIAFFVLRGNYCFRIIFTLILIFSLAVFHVVFPEVKIIHYYAITIGCLLALFLSNRQIFTRLRFLGMRKQSLTIWAIFLFLQLSLCLFPVFKWVYPIATALALASIIMSPLQVLTWRPLVYIGQRSYGIYLVHILCLRAVKLIFPGDTTNLWISLLGFAAGTLLSIVVAEVLYRLIEGPFISFGRPISKAVLARPRASLEFR